MDAPKKKAGRPPAPVMLGIARRDGDGYKLTVALAGLLVNGRKFDPQAGAELVADMLEDGMRRLKAMQPAAPAETAVEDLPALETAIAPGENGSH